MPQQVPSATPHRKQRADAQRNRERILEVAKLVFTQRGAEATLDDIARQAGVGPGTLYRHFPTRDDLIEAVYRSEVQKLTAKGRQLAGSVSPLEALRSWSMLLVDHVADKKLILPVMDTVPGGSYRLIEGARDDIHGTFMALAKRAIRNGDLRPDLDPGDLMRAMIGVFYMSATPDWQASAHRIVDILISGAQVSR